MASKRSRRSRKPEWAKCLSRSHPAVREDLRASSDLPSFLAGAASLSRNQRRRIVEQARALLDLVYVHLPLKQSMHAIDPVQALRLLQHRLDQIPSDHEFNREMIEIFVSLRDLHTVYVLPNAYQGYAAYLPFLVEEYFEGEIPRYIVSHWIQQFSHTRFARGSEILYWNGIPIDRAVALNADLHAGSNMEARRARGVEALTLRALATALPPDEHWVDIHYRSPGGREGDVRFEWVVAPFSELKITPAGPPGNDPAVALDIEGDLMR